MDWQMIASAFCGVSAALVAVVWKQTTTTLTRLTDRLEQLGLMVHGHEIRIKNTERNANGR